MAKTEYEVLKGEIKKKVKAAGGTRHSKSDLTAMTHSLLNSPDQEVKTYIKDPDHPVTSKPVERYRESLKPVLKQFGVDAAELNKVQDVNFSKEHAEALTDVATTVMKDYIDVGRKLVLPITDPAESQMEISQVERPYKEEETKKLEQMEDGSYKQVPTGKRKKTKAHKELKASNKLPAWLVDLEEV